MNMFKWFKSLFSSEDSVDTPKEIIHDSPSYVEEMYNRVHRFYIHNIRIIRTDGFGIISKFILESDASHLMKGDVIEVEGENIRFVIYKDTEHNRRGNGYYYYCIPYNCGILEHRLVPGMRLFKTHSVDIDDYGITDYSGRYGSAVHYSSTYEPRATKNYSSSSDSDIAAHLLLSPFSPVSIWNSSNDSDSDSGSSSNSYDSSSSYDSGSSDSGGGDCGGGD